MELDDSVPESADRASGTQGYPVSFQASLASFLVLELVLGVGSNLTVLLLYCVHSGLVESVSNAVTVNLHVLDTVTCLVSLPLTISVVLGPPERHAALVCCWHEACVSFSSMATASSVLLISLDRYDMSVRPANRLLTPGRAVLLLAAVWMLSLLVFSVPFVELELLSAAGHNRSLLCGPGPPRQAAGHLWLQIPGFLLAVCGMLAAYSRILRALNIRIGSYLGRGHKRPRARRKGPATHYESRRLTPASGAQPPALGVHASVSVIIALRRAVKRHRDRRQRQRRLLRMSLVIVATFLLCWAPISVANLLLLCLGPSDRLLRLRLCALAPAYATTALHPLLYALARHKFRKVLRSKLHKRPGSELQEGPAPSATLINNPWLEPRKDQRRGSGRPPQPPSEDKA